MSLVPISAVKDFLTGSIWDKFKELIEPYALVNAVIFIVLNLILVLPAAGTGGAESILGTLTTPTDATDPTATNLDVWRLLLITIMVLVSSYFINHLSTFFINLVSGEIFRDSLLGWGLKAWQKRSYTKLKADALPGFGDDDPDSKYKRDRAFFRLAYEFPVDETDLGLTRLGNVLLNPPSYVAHQYGANMQLLWPIIQEQIKDDNKTLKSTQGNWVSLLFFTSLCGILGFIMMELILISAFRESGITVWHIVGLSMFAWICYRTSLEKARQWSRGMRILFDLHARNAFTALGMDALKDLHPAISDFKSNWEKVLEWLAFGAMRGYQFKPKETWYKAAPSPEKWPKLTHPEFLSVKLIKRFVVKEMFSQKNNKGFACIDKSMEYSFAITNTGTGESPLSGESAYLLIQDSGITPPDTINGRLSTHEIRHKFPKFEQVFVSYKDIPVTGQRQAGDPASVLFPLGSIPPGVSLILTYFLDSYIANVKTSDFEIATVEIGKSRAASFTETFIDIFFKAIPEAKKGELTVELLDDNKTKLNSHAELFFVLPEIQKHIKGEMSEGKRISIWSLPLEPQKTEKLRIRLRG